MPFVSNLAGEVKDINPDLASPADVNMVCILAQERLNQMLTNGMPLSQQERDTEKILDEVDIIMETLRRDDVIARWKEEKLAHALLRRLSELEERAYNVFLTSLESLETDNPLHTLAEEYRRALEMKDRGEIQGVIMLEDPTDGK